MKGSSSVSVLISLGLFAIFTLFLLLVLLTGTAAFKNVSEVMNTRYTDRTSLLYISQKIRRTNGEISIGGIKKYYNEIPALLLKEKYDDEIYTTYIYYDDGYLKELYIEGETDDLTADEGTEILETKELSFEFAKPGLLKLRSGENDMFVGTAA